MPKKEETGNLLKRGSDDVIGRGNAGDDVK